MTRLGYQIPNFTYPDTTPATLFDVVAAQAKEADASGFDTVLVMDHFYQLPMIGPADNEMLECYSVLSALARETRKVRLSALVTGNTYRNPAVLAKTVTTLDIVSNGRGQLGIGAGWFELEHDAFGIEFGTFTDRFEKLEEALQIIIPMLRGERPTLDGKRYQVREAINSPAPASRIPVMIGGGGERKTLRMVAQYADESNMICAVDELPRKLDVLAGALRDARPRPQRADRLVPALGVHRPDDGGGPGRRRRVRRPPRADGAASAAMVTGRIIVGDPDTVGEQLAKDMTAGIDGFTINLVANGHKPGRVTLLGETAAKVVFG